MTLYETAKLNGSKNTYTIYFENQAEFIKVGEYDTFEHAKDFCEQTIAGKSKKHARDNTYDFERLHIYKGEPNEIVDDLCVSKDPVYSTDCYYDLLII